MGIPQRQTAQLLRNIATDIHVKDNDFQTLLDKLEKTAEAGKYQLDDAFTTAGLTSLLNTPKQTDFRYAIENLGYETSTGSAPNDLRINWQEL